MKRVMVFIILLIICAKTSVFAEFSDMANESEEVKQAVTALTEKKYIRGESDTEFAPQKNISRAEFATIILRITDCMGEMKPYYMTDVSKRSWYYYVAGSAIETGVMTGFEDSTFRGDNPIGRAQAIAIIARVIQSRIDVNSENISLNFSDEIPPWAYEYVKIAVGEKIIENEGVFNADEAITRGKVSVMLLKMYNKIVDTLEYKSYDGDYELKTPPITIVLDAGHGKDSGYMSDDERFSEGWLWNSDKNQWGEWRHWKWGTTWQDCMGYGCSGRGNCWYRMENGDRDTEPDINLNNTLSAAKYLEEMGYEVRLTRNSNMANPSMTKRLIYCYPNNDTSAVPDGDLFVCIHSNAGGGRGSAYIQLEGTYDQVGIPEDYAYIGNTLGKYINDEIAAETSMTQHGAGYISGEPELILFCKSPIPIAYMEIGFFDNSSDLAILNSEYDAIGKAIANGIDKYCHDTGMAE